MQKNVLKQHYKTVILICILLFLVGYYFYSNSEINRDISSEISNHINLIKISNEISSYAKSAEGHMLLYLTIGNQTDREKVPERAAALKDYINQLESMVSGRQPVAILGQLRNKHEELVQLSVNIFSKYDLSGLDYVRSNKGKEDIQELHSISSSIRKIGVKLVDISSTVLQHKKAEIESNNRTKYQILGVLTAIVFFFLIIISYQGGKLSASAQVAGALEKLSLNDVLTGAGNRRFFEEQYEKEWRRCIRSNTSFVLLLIDIDHFKNFNDTYGHARGDECLRKVAKGLKECLRRPTDIFARYIGEEFVAILPETSDPLKIAEFCRFKVESLAIPNLGSEVSDFVTVSVGFGIVSPTQESNPDKFFNLVDKALYKAKSNGRNQISEALI